MSYAYVAKVAFGAYNFFYYNRLLTTNLINNVILNYKMADSTDYW